MKRTKRFILTAVLAAAALFLCGVPAVSAGVSNTVVCDSDDFSSGLNMGEWYTSVNDIKGTEEGIVFGESLASGSRIASRTQLYNPQADPAAESFSAELTFNVKKQIAGRIAVSFGLRLPNSETGSANTTAVYLASQEEKIVLGVSNYDAQGAENTVLEAKDTGVALSGESAKVELSLSVSQGGGIEVLVGETQMISDADAGCAAAGYFGVSITAAGNSFAVEKIRLAGYSNNTPENTNIMENFDKNCYNTADLRTAVPYGGQGVLLPQNGALAFSGLMEGYISTTNRYSNSELAFDIPFLRRTPAYDEEQNLTAPVSAGFSVALGCTSADSLTTNAAVTFKLVPSGGNNMVAPTATHLEVYEGNELLKTVHLPHAYNIWDENIVAGRSVGVVINVKDGSVSFGLRFDNEIGYTNLYTGTFSSNPDGFIRIYADGTPVSQAGSLSANSVRKCDFTIDNLSVTNMDEDARVVVSEYVASYSEVGDYEYGSTWDDEDMLFFD